MNCGPERRSTRRLPFCRLTVPPLRSARVARQLMRIDTPRSYHVGPHSTGDHNAQSAALPQMPL